MIFRAYSIRRLICSATSAISRHLLRALFLLLAIFFFSPTPCPAKEQCATWIAKVVSIEGNMEVMRSGSGSWTALAINDTFCPGDRVRVNRMSRATVLMANEAVLRLGQNTTLIFVQPQELEQRALIRLLKGVVNFFSRIPRSLGIQTPFVNGSVEGTEFLVRVEDDRAIFTVFRGLILAANSSGRLKVASGQTMLARQGNKPEPLVLLHPREGVRWALYYPAIIAPQAAAPTKGSPRAVLLEAADLLAVGGVNEARRLLKSLMACHPDSGEASALLAIIALVENDRQRAARLAEKAVQQSPGSASCRIARSYVFQAQFAIDKALRGVRQAVELEPKNGLARARLAELWLMVGELDKARQEAERAAALSPSVARSQSVLGFARLARMDAAGAMTAFAKAISLDQGAPLPRLGKGLAEIRQGNLARGRADIDIAAALDPDNSLIRSYLGKAFFDEKRYKLANRQFRLATELDPADPTPYLYDAALKQAENRPVEALADLQQSIVLNDNRAVYRSRLLLDEDLAVRTTGLARVYDDLNFEQLALVEGWKTLNIDPANYSAHRFLADTLGSRPRHEIARDSELLQAQLLQPLNTTPQQPRLAGGTPFIWEETAPGSSSFNEFSPLFVQEGVSMQASAVAGGKGILGDEMALAGLAGRLSASVGQFHYESDGFRENNDQRRNVYNLFTQYTPRFHTILLAEYRKTSDDFGDLPLRFDDLYFPTERQNDDSDSIRAGVHHILMPGSDLIATAIYRNYTSELSSAPDGYRDLLETDSWMAEAQHILRRNQLNLITGGGYFSQDLTQTGNLFQETIYTCDEHDTHTNLYLYSQLNMPRQVTWTLGAGGDLYRGIIDRNQFNPKLGVTWDLTETTTLRAAVMRTLHRSIILSQTIEPTQVAGFNQFFDDVEGTDAWRYGIGVDQKFSNGLFGGMEYSRRDLDVPYLDMELHVNKTSWQEEMFRSYLYWTPLLWLSTTAEYRWQRFDRDLDSTGAEHIHLLKTHKVPLTVTAYSPSGLIAELRTTYVDQSGEFDINPLSFTTRSGNDRFWIVDLALRYRLPRQYGICSIEARNLFDQQFQYQNTDPVQPDYIPERLILARLTVAF